MQPRRSSGGRHGACTHSMLAAMIQEAPLKKYPRDIVLYHFFNLCARKQIRQTKSIILQVPDGAWIR
jgi:hypothetical protein